jgi:hypothetical protein
LESLIETLSVDESELAGVKAKGDEVLKETQSSLIGLRVEFTSRGVFDVAIGNIVAGAKTRNPVWRGLERESSS